MQWIYAFLSAMWAELIGAGAILETGELILIGADFSPAPDNTEAGLTRPTFTGYADAAIAAWLPAVTGVGTPYVTRAPIMFSPTDAVNLPQFIYGAGILDSNGDLVAVTKFDAPIQLSFPTQRLHVTPKLFLDPTTPAQIEAYTD